MNPLKVGDRVRCRWSGDAHQTGVVSMDLSVGSFFRCLVQWDDRSFLNYCRDIRFYSVDLILLTPQEEEHLADQKKRQAHAARYL